MKEYLLWSICNALKIVTPKKYLNGIPVLMYHSISEQPSRLAICPEKFNRQMSYLRKEGFQVISPLDLKKESNLKKKIIITFDDGFKDNYTTAFPIMKKYGFEGTVFISTDYIGGKSSFCKKESDKHFEMLDEDEIKKLDQAGWCIANHFASHRDLVDLEEQNIVGEYRKSSFTLMDIIGQKESTLIVSIPHSKQDKRVLNILEKEEVKLIFSGGNDFYYPESNTRLVPRVEIFNLDDQLKFKLRTNPVFCKIKNLMKRQKLFEYFYYS